MADETSSPPPPPAPSANPTSCGCYAALALFALAALPALILAGMQGGACEGGPCHPERVVGTGTVLFWLAAAAALVGLAVRALVAARQRAAGDGAAERRRSPAWAWTTVAAAALAALALLVFAMG